VSGVDTAGRQSRSPIPVKVLGGLPTALSDNTQIIRSQSPLPPNTIFSHQGQTRVVYTNGPPEYRVSRTPEKVHADSHNANDTLNVSTSVIYGYPQGKAEPRIYTSAPRPTFEGQSSSQMPVGIKFYEPHRLSRVVEMTDSQAVQKESSPLTPSKVRVMTSSPGEIPAELHKSQNDLPNSSKPLNFQPQIKIYQSSGASKFQNAQLLPPPPFVNSSNSPRVVRSPSPTKPSSNTVVVDINGNIRGDIGRRYEYSPSPIGVVSSQSATIPGQTGPRLTATATKVYAMPSQNESKPAQQVVGSSKSPSRIFVHSPYPFSQASPTIQGSSPTEHRPSQWTNAIPSTTGKTSPTFYRPYS